MGRYLALLDVDVTTRAGYEGYIRNHVQPLLGHLQVGKLDGETLDSFYAILRRCRAHCDGRPFVEHRTTGEHTCDAKYRPHTCRPLASSVRQVHFCSSEALKRAVRWHWIGVNPLEQAEPPRGIKHDPQPPVRRAGCRGPQRGVLGRRVGRNDLARDDDRRPAGRALRPALERA